MPTVLQSLASWPVLLLGVALQTESRQLQPHLRRALGAVDVPLARMPGASSVGKTAGVSFLDYDADGWVDLYVNHTARLWRNEGGTFRFVADLDAFLPPVLFRYGATCGDLDNDGLPDIASEPRNDCFFLLKNVDGAGLFLEVGRDPEIVLDPPGCAMWGETFCWADVDVDGDLDLWVTSYSDEVRPGSDGNQFYENLGATGPGGVYRLARRTAESGLGLPAGFNRPEGAQFVDADRDGDLDAFANGTFYQNVTADEGPRFRQLVGAPTGISLTSRVDEGVLFFDYDLDGDEDLLVVYRDFANRIWENEGDGTFFHALDVIEQPREGATIGCSAEDWDLDGDLDMTTGHVFRRNLMVESGEHSLRIATHSLAAVIGFPIPFPTPAWCDWDKDGDVDCMFATWLTQGTFLQNTTYSPETPALAKLSLRVRPVRDAPSVPRGLETEFGAAVEVRVHGDARGFVRRRFVASSHGYLQQSEYALTLAVPAGSNPAEPARGVTFDLLVDFPSLAASGILRIDRTVNPILGGLALDALAEREVTVFRSGRVLIDATVYPPREVLTHHLASTGALVLPEPLVALAEPVPAPAENWFVGMELDTDGSDGAVWVEELVLDGQLVPAGAARCAANVLLLDVTPGATPRTVHAERLATSPRNDRSFLPLAWKLAPQSVYRVLCRVCELRASPVQAVNPEAALVSRGALSFATPDLCDPSAALLAEPDGEHAFFELRFRSAIPDEVDERRDLCTTEE